MKEMTVSGSAGRGDNDSRWQNSWNCLQYTLYGPAVPGGWCFFIHSVFSSSLLSGSTTIVWGGEALLTEAGSFLFLRAGISVAMGEAVPKQPEALKTF